VARATFFCPDEPETLDFKLLANPARQVSSPQEYVAAERGRLRLLQVQLPAHFLENFFGKKGDLAFVIRFVIEKTVSPNAEAGDTFNLGRGYDGMIARRASMMAKIVVIG
jgi:hypothetical protein